MVTTTMKIGDDVLWLNHPGVVLVFLASSNTVLVRFQYYSGDDVVLEVYSESLDPLPRSGDKETAAPVGKPMNALDAGLAVRIVDPDGKEDLRSTSAQDSLPAQAPDWLPCPKCHHVMDWINRRSRGAHTRNCKGEELVDAGEPAATEPEASGSSEPAIVEGMRSEEAVRAVLDFLEGVETPGEETDLEIRTLKWVLNE